MYQFLGFFLSMWVSNVAAPVLLVFLVLPIVKEIDRESKYGTTRMSYVARNAYLRTTDFLRQYCLASPWPAILVA